MDLALATLGVTYRSTLKRDMAHLVMRAAAESVLVFVHSRSVRHKRHVLGL